MVRHRTSPWLRPWIFVVVLVTLGAAACGDDDPRQVSAAAPTTGASTATTAKGPSGDAVVLAAASLTESFTELGEAFGAAYPEASVTFSFASSSSLVAQVNSGAPADVFASADEPNMQKAVDAGNVANPRTFTRNRLALLVQKGNPTGITGLADLDRSGVIYVTCRDGVPCGTYGKEALTRAGVTRQPKSLEADVKAVVTKVTVGEADAGIVYATDARAVAGKSDSLDIPDEHNVLANYPIAVLKQANNPDVAAAFIDFILSAPGQAIMAKYGFLPAS